MTTASRARGFTLIELLVVLLLVALGSSLVALSLRDTPQHLLEREADRLIVVLENARAQARSRSTPLLWQADEQGLPWLTVVMLTLSSWVQALWLWLLIAGAAGAVLLKLALRQTGFREQFDAAWLRLPLLGRLSLGYNAARFAGTLALLVGAGVPMLKALQTAAQTLSNTALRANAMQAIELVREGAPLAPAPSVADE